MTMPLPAPRPLEALNRALGRVESVRNGRAVCALLATFAAAGLLLFGEACGRPRRDVAQALRDALASAWCSSRC
jgi:hypothetical protein